MMNTPKTSRTLSFTAAAFALMLACGCFAQVFAQRDPFAQPSYKKVRTAPPPTAAKKTTAPVTPSVPVSYAPPTIEQRIDYYKRMREAAAANGSPLPKVTSVLTLNEMAVTGIFKTPRGYAAMVEATPIKLSYTIYPGEKFFDGQLVAVEDNRLVFRKVTKTGEGKFVASVENKALRKYTMKAEVEGTAPAQPSEKTADAGSNTGAPVAAAQPAAVKTTVTSFVSPVDEMNAQSAKQAEAEKNKSAAPAKKPAKVAKTKN